MKQNIAITLIAFLLMSPQGFTFGETTQPQILLELLSTCCMVRIRQTQNID